MDDDEALMEGLHGRSAVSIVWSPRYRNDQQHRRSICLQLYAASNFTAEGAKNIRRF